MYCEWNWFLNFMIVHCQDIEIQLIFVYLSCILQTYWTQFFFFLVQEPFVSLYATQCPADLYKPIFNYSSLIDSLELTIYKIMSFVNKKSFISSFSIWMPFTSFSYLIYQLEFPIYCENEVVTVDLFVLFPILERRHSVFHH